MRIEIDKFFTLEVTIPENINAENFLGIVKNAERICKQCINVGDTDIRPRTPQGQVPKGFWGDDKMSIIENEKSNGMGMRAIHAKHFPDTIFKSMAQQWYKYCRRNKLNKSVQKGRHISKFWNDDQMELIRDCRKRGLTFRQIQEKYYPSKDYKAVNKAFWDYEKENKNK